MEKKLRITLAFLVAVTVVGLLVMLPYRLYQRDIDVAQQHARVVSDELSNMIKLTMLTTKDVLSLNPNLGLGVVIGKIEALYAQFGDERDFRFRVIRSAVIENQYGKVEGRGADSAEARAVFEGGKPVSAVDGAILTYWSPIRADDRCGHCHKDANKKRVKQGATLGVVETVFDLTRQRDRSIRTIIEITGFMMVMIVVMALVSLIVIRKNLIQPIQALADALNRRRAEPRVKLPKFTAPELIDLVDAIDGPTEAESGGKETET